MAKTHRSKKPGASLASNLLRLRKAQHLSQATLAKKAGLPSMTVSHYECDRRTPSVANLQRLAWALDVRIDQLLGS